MSWLDSERYLNESINTAVISNGAVIDVMIAGTVSITCNTSICDLFLNLCHLVSKVILGLSYCQIKLPET